MKMNVMLVLVGVMSLVLAQTPPQLWPKPSNIVTMSAADEFYLTASQFRFTAIMPDGAGSATDILYNAFDRYYQIIFANPSSGATSDLTQITGLQVTVLESTSFIQFGVNETYSLNVTAPTCTIVAQTIFGAMHGLETFSQLLRNGITPQAYIIDTPRFPWRGLLLDTSRHYQELSTIRELIRGLSYDKMNTFHWHMSDGQSFPYQSQVYPNLTKGAYCPECVYSIEEIKAVINFANSYGVRVVVEFDMPSHAGPSWGKGYPFLTMNCSTAQCETFDLQYSDPCNDFPFDATNDAVYEFLQNFLQEVATVFPDNYLHMGGDEVQEICWATEPVLEWMKAHNMTSFSELEQYFLSNVQSYAAAENKLIVNWEEVFTSGFKLLPGTIIEVWKDKTTLDSVAEAGYGALLAYGWYLDHLGSTWQDFYTNDPSDGTLNSQQEAFLFGGECCMWSEYVDATNVQPKVWPRTSAAAERLWSPQTVNSVTEAQKRLTYQRCRFLNRGLNATPIYPGPPCSTFNL